MSPLRLRAGVHVAGPLYLSASRGRHHAASVAPALVAVAPPAVGLIRSVALMLWYALVLIVLVPVWLVVTPCGWLYRLARRRWHR